MMVFITSELPRPSREEMSKVSDSKPAAPKKKPIVQEKVTSPSNELKQIILDMCGKDKDFATNVWKYTTDRVKVKPGMPESIVDYTEDDQKTFIDVAPKKKPIVQEKVTSPSNELKQIILDMCGKDKDFATNVWKYTTDRVKVKPGMPESIVDYTEDDQKTFIDVASKYIDKQKKTFEERQGNSDVINTIIEH